jgi:hypothetical protein
MKNAVLVGAIALSLGYSVSALAQDAATAPAADPAAVAAAAPAADPAAAAAAAPATDQAVVPDAAPAVPAAEASTVSDALAAKIGKPEAGKGMVVFFRPSKFVGAAAGFKVREDGKELGKLRNGNWFAIQAEPGAHEYDVHGEKHDVTNIEVEAGETYFLSGAMGMGFVAGRPNLSPSSAAAFEAIMAKLKASKPLG